MAEAINTPTSFERVEASSLQCFKYLSYLFIASQPQEVLLRVVPGKCDANRKLLTRKYRQRAALTGKPRQRKEEVFASFQVRQHIHSCPSKPRSLPSPKSCHHSLLHLLLYLLPLHPPSLASPPLSPNMDLIA